MSSQQIPSLSLCVIAKNEEQTLPRCLSSVKKFVDEIVLVDTGSNQFITVRGCTFLNGTVGINIAGATEVVIEDCDLRGYRPIGSQIGPTAGHHQNSAFP